MLQLFVASLLMLVSASLQAELLCPESTRLRGAKPPQANELYCVLADGTRHGPYRHWYANGQLMESRQFRHGKEHGPQIVWWPNGQMMMRGESVYGKRYRQFEYWDSTGQPRQLELKVIRESATEILDGQPDKE